jgi:hypothetical protein
VEIRGATLADFEAAVTKVSADYDGNLVVHRDSYQSGSLVRARIGVASSREAGARRSWTGRRPVPSGPCPYGAGRLPRQGRVRAALPRDGLRQRREPDAARAYARAMRLLRAGSRWAAYGPPICCMGAPSSASCGSLLLLVSFLAPMAAEQ